TGEVGDIERYGSPEADDASQRRNEEAKEFAKVLKFGRRCKHGTEATRLAARPEQQRQADEEQERRGDSLQETDRFDAAQNHQNVEQPERCEAHRGTVREVSPAGGERDEHGINGFAADPRLNAEPAARNERAQYRR